VVGLINQPIRAVHPCIRSLINPPTNEMNACVRACLLAQCTRRNAQYMMRIVAFLVFECCVGIYFPAMGTMKSNIVPEESRAALYNLFRVPLNVIVLGVLLSDMKTSVAFGWSSA
jgi:hypothetical protein